MPLTEATITPLPALEIQSAQARTNLREQLQDLLCDGEVFANRAIWLQEPVHSGHWEALGRIHASEA